MNPDYESILDYLSSFVFNPVFQEILECFTYPPFIEFKYQFTLPDPQTVILQVPIPVIEGMETPNGSRVKNGMVIYETRWQDKFCVNRILKLSFDSKGWILSCMIDNGKVAVSEYAEIYSLEHGLFSLDRRPFGFILERQSLSNAVAFKSYHPVKSRISSSILEI
jgi:hypothetical protein